MRWLVLMVPLAVLGCGEPSEHAAGSGYGVGIPRVHFMLGESRYADDRNRGLRADAEQPAELPPRAPRAGAARGAGF